MLKKWPKADISFVIPIYGGTVHIYYEQDKFNKALAFIGCEEYILKEKVNGGCKEFVNSENEIIYVILWSSKLISTLVHELTHCALTTLDRVGINVKVEDTSSQEVLCYLLGELVYKTGFDDKLLPLTVGKSTKEMK